MTNASATSTADESRSAASPRRHLGVLIVGSGFAGLGAAIRLTKDGREDFLVVERGSEVGGTWRDNTYPGAACDVPSHLYSYSFELNPHWSRSFSPQPEIQDYLRSVAAKYNVGDKHLFDTEVTQAKWDAGANQWLVDTTSGDFSANVLVTAVGALCEPQLPKIKGIETFRGELFHSARWNHDAELQGKRVALIGTGASAIQVGPAIAGASSGGSSGGGGVAQLDVYQRTAPWTCRVTTAATRSWKASPISASRSCSASRVRPSTGAGSPTCWASPSNRRSCSSCSASPSATSRRTSATPSCAPG